MSPFSFLPSYSGNDCGHLRSPLDDQQINRYFTKDNVTYCDGIAVICEQWETKAMRTMVPGSVGSRNSGVPELEPKYTINHDITTNF